MAIDRLVEVQLAPELLWMFYPMLQEGVEVEVETGCSIRELLTEQFGIPGDYITGRITTLFLNSRAVDDASTALVQDRAVLALSGAMPGLVGATMRSGGYYAVMRGAMTHRADPEIPKAKGGRIRIKLFNLLLEELGPRILRRGVILEAGQLREFLAGRPEESRFQKCRVEGQTVSVEALSKEDELGAAGRLLKFKVHFGEG